MVIAVTSNGVYYNFIHKSLSSASEKSIQVEEFNMIKAAFSYLQFYIINMILYYRRKIETFCRRHCNIFQENIFMMNFQAKKVVEGI